MATSATGSVASRRSVAGRSPVRNCQRPSRRVSPVTVGSAAGSLRGVRGGVFIQLDSHAALHLAAQIGDAIDRHQPPAVDQRDAVAEIRPR